MILLYGVIYGLYWGVGPDIIPYPELSVGGLHFS